MYLSLREASMREASKTTFGVSNAVTSSRSERVVRLLKAQCVFMCPLTLQSGARIMTYGTDEIG